MILYDLGVLSRLNGTLNFYVLHMALSLLTGVLSVEKVIKELNRPGHEDARRRVELFLRILSKRLFIEAAAAFIIYFDKHYRGRWTTPHHCTWLALLLRHAERVWRKIVKPLFVTAINGELDEVVVNLNGEDRAAFWEQVRRQMNAHIINRNMELLHSEFFNAPIFSGIYPPTYAECLEFLIADDRSPTHEFVPMAPAPIYTMNDILNSPEEFEYLECLSALLEIPLTELLGCDDSLSSQAITRENLNYVNNVVNNLRPYLLKTGRGYKVFTITTHQVPTIYFVEKLFSWLKSHNTFKDLLNNEQFNALSVTFNINNSTHWVALNHSFTFNNESTLLQWKTHWMKGLSNLIESNYSAELCIAIELRIYGIKYTIPRYTISPTSPKANINHLIGVLDIETLTLDDGTLLPYAIGFRLINTKTNFQELKTFYLTTFILDGVSAIEASNKIMYIALRQLLNIGKGYTIYIHNLGSFDGIFLVKPLVELYGSFNIIIDKSKEFISFELPRLKIKFRDSLRIFPTSLAALSKMFNVPIPKGEFNHSKVTLNNLEEIRAELINYLTRDLISLSDIITTATITIFNNYSVDLSLVFSSSSLAIKIFRTNYLNTNIPTLPTNVESEIRSGYRGGATQVFAHIGNNLHYYDVNSLYPFSITKYIPHYYLGRIPAKGIFLDTFFGFISAKVTPPSTLNTPILPYLPLNSEKVEYPSTEFTSIFFAEELRYAKSIGYKIEMNYGYEFSSMDLFSNYVNYFYNLKSLATGGERYIVKLLLNGLYGYFARTTETFETIFSDNKAYKDIINRHPIIDELDITDNLSLTLYNPNITINSIEQSHRRPVLSNVAIAAAITSYSRIIINPYKIDTNNPCFYSDTDSIFIQYPLNPKLIGTSLGQFKDELKGDVINTAIFIKPKCYGYVLNSGLEKVVIAGFPIGDVPFNSLKSVLTGENIKITSPTLLRDIKTMSIKSTKITRTLSIQS